MNPDSFNVKIHGEHYSAAKITLAASNGNSDYDKTVGVLNTMDNTVKLTKNVPVTYLSRITAACEEYVKGSSPNVYK